MKLSDVVHIPALPEKVWRGLNDPELLKAAIPGCKSIEKVSDTEFNATAAVTFGPVKATFSGKVKLSDLDPPHGYRISGEGAGGAAGFANGSAIVRLAPRDNGTDLTYEVEASVGGKIAQIGQRFIDQAAKKMADDFFGRFAAALSAPPASEPPVDSAPPAAAAPTETPAKKTVTQKVIEALEPTGFLLAAGKEQFAEQKRNIPLKLVILVLAVAVLVLIVRLTR